MVRDEPATAPPLADDGSIYDQIMAMMDDGQLTEQEMEQASILFMGAGLGQQAANIDYQNDYLTYLGDTLKLNQQQLAQAQQEMEFKQGPYWDWYKSEYFPYQQQLARDQVTMSGNQVKVGEQEIERARQGALQAASYAEAQNYQTQVAQIQKEIAEYQALQQFGRQGRTVRLPDGRMVYGNLLSLGSESYFG